MTGVPKLHGSNGYISYCSPPTPVRARSWGGGEDQWELNPFPLRFISLLGTLKHNIISISIHVKENYSISKHPLSFICHYPPPPFKILDPPLFLLESGLVYRRG